MASPAYGRSPSVRLRFISENASLLCMFVSPSTSHFTKLLTRARFFGPCHWLYIFVPCLVFRVHVAGDLNKTISFVLSVLTTSFTRANCPRMPHRVYGPGQNRHQKVFHLSPSCLCKGARHSENLFLIHNMNSICRLCTLHCKYFPANTHDTARSFQLKCSEWA